MDGNKKGMIRDLLHLPPLFKAVDVSVFYFMLYFLVMFYGTVDWVAEYNLLALLTVLIFIFTAGIAELYRSRRGVFFLALNYFRSQGYHSKTVSIIGCKLQSL